MKRIATLLAAAFLVAGCGSDSSTPSVTQVTVTVMQNGAPLSGISVVECAGVTPGSLNPPTLPVEFGVVESKATNASGQAVFNNIPGSTSTGELCFSVTQSLGGGYSHGQSCRTLNNLVSAVTIEIL